jgi:hypothetical protein
MAHAVSEKNQAAGADASTANPLMEVRNSNTTSNKYNATPLIGTNRNNK